MEEVNSWINNNETLVFYSIVALALVLNRLPFIGVFFRSVNTLFHESGHALGAIITSGEVVKIELNKDTSGVAQTKTKSKSGTFITSFAGYPFAALSSSLLLILALSGHHKLVAYILMLFVSFNLLFFVRNAFGIVWLLLFACFIGFSVWYANDLFLKILILFVSSVAFTEAFFSTLYITVLSLTKPKSSGDMVILQKTTGLPASFWGLVNMATVSYVLYYTIIHYFPVINTISELTE